MENKSAKTKRILLAVGSLFSAIGLVISGHYLGKSSYYEVGLSDGKIEALYSVYNRFEADLGPLLKCDQIKNVTLKELVAVKAIGIYWFKDGAEKIQFCKY